MAAESARLGTRAVQGALLVGLSTYANMLASLISTVVLARILLPDDFGIVGLGMVIVSLIGRLRELGFQYALMHRQDDVEKAAATHLTLQTGLSLLVFAVSLIAFPVVESVYGHLTAMVVVALALAGVVEGWGSTPRVLLDKDLRFPRVALVEATGAVVAAAAGIGAAILGMGVWSLVLREGARTVYFSVGYWIACPRRPRFGFDRSLAGWFLGYGPYWYWFLASIATLVLLQADDFAVGTMVGVAALGYYGRAYELATVPTGAITHVISRITMPAYAKLQDDRGRLSRAYSFALSIILRLALPVCLLLALAAEELIIVILGDHWGPTTLLLQLLMGYALLRPLLDDAGALYVAIGRPGTVASVNNLQAGLMLVILVPLTYFYAAEGAALAVDMVMAVGVIVAFYFLRRYVDIPYRQTFLAPLVGALAAAVATGLVSRQLSGQGMLIRLGVKAASVGVPYLLVLGVAEGKQLLSYAQYLWSAATAWRR